MNGWKSKSLESPKAGYALFPWSRRDNERPRLTVQPGPLRCVKLLVCRADLHRLHAGLGLGFRLEGAVIYNGRRACGWLCVDNGAFLGRGIPDHIVLRCSLREHRRNRKCAERANNQELLHGCFPPVCPRRELPEMNKVPLSAARQEGSACWRPLKIMTRSAVSPVWTNLRRPA